MSGDPGGEGRRESARLEAFSDGVMAIIITIMAFGLDVPKDTTWHAAAQQLPSLLVYALSFTMIGIYWNNHHHLLLWLSLIPVATKWLGEKHQAHLPASVYGIIGFGAAVAYGLLVQAIIRANGRDSAVAKAIGSDVKGRVSIVLFAAAAGFAWLSPWIAYALYVAVAIVWFVPDRRFKWEAPV